MYSDAGSGADSARSEMIDGREEPRTEEEQYLQEVIAPALGYMPGMMTPQMNLYVVQERKKLEEQTRQARARMDEEEVRRNQKEDGDEILEEAVEAHQDKLRREARAAQLFQKANGTIGSIDQEIMIIQRLLDRRISDLNDRIEALENGPRTPEQEEELERLKDERDKVEEQRQEVDRLEEEKNEIQDRLEALKEKMENGTISQEEIEEIEELNSRLDAIKARIEEILADQQAKIESIARNDEREEEIDQRLDSVTHPDESVVKQSQQITKQEEVAADNDSGLGNKIDIFADLMAEEEGAFSTGGSQNDWIADDEMKSNVKLSHNFNEASTSSDEAYNAANDMPSRDNVDSRELNHNNTTSQNIAIPV